MKYFLLIALICADVFLILTRKKSWTRKKASKGNNNGTVIIPYLYLEQLDPRNLNKCHRRFNLTEEQLMSTGMAITRAGSNRGEIPLDCVFNETMTVGEEHAVVALDKHGCFIQNNHKNGMWILRGDTLERQNEVVIDEGTIVYLGKQPIRFSYPKITVTPHSTSWSKIWLTLRMLAGNLVGFSGKNKKRTKARREETDEW